jgi:hypothetical protein
MPKYVSLPKVEACFGMLPFGTPLYNNMGLKMGLLLGTEKAKKSPQPKKPKRK